jgi:hypothetical protein
VGGEARGAGRNTADSNSRSNSRNANSRNANSHEGRFGPVFTNPRQTLTSFLGGGDPEQRALNGDDGQRFLDKNDQAGTRDSGKWLSPPLAPFI